MADFPIAGICERCRAKFYSQESYDTHRRYYHAAQDEKDGLTASQRKIHKEKFFSGEIG